MSDLDVRINSYRKNILSLNPKFKNYPKSNIFIFGCQRSGTSMLRRVFDSLAYSKVFDEYNSLVNLGTKDNQLQLTDITQLDFHLRNERRPMKVMKPLVDSQRTNQILDAVCNSHAIWIVREYTAVAESNIRSFGEESGAFAHVDALINGSDTNWRSQYVSKKTQNLIRDFDRETLTAMDAAALFWYSRNILFFEQNLQHRRDVEVYHYEQFTQQPQKTLNNTIVKLGYPTAPNTATAFVQPNVEKQLKKQNVLMNETILQLCKELHNKFKMLQ